MTDWATVSSLATAAGTLVLAGATFIAVRAGRESTRVTERALLAGLRPVLITPQIDDPPQKVRFRDDHMTLIQPGRGIADFEGDTIYLAFCVRNAGSGVAVLDRWRPVDHSVESDISLDFDQYRRLTRDIYVPANGVGFWQGAIRDTDDPAFAPVAAAIKSRTNLAIDVLYGDYEGGQQTVTRFVLFPYADGDWTAQVVRNRNVDRPDPR